VPWAWILPAALAVWLAIALRGGLGGAWTIGVALLLRLAFLGSDAHSDDLHRYVWEGQVVAAGASPYATTPSDPELASLRGDGHARINHPELPTIYPPLAQGLFALAALAGLGEVGLKNVFLLLDVGVVLGLALWLARTGRPLGRAAIYAWSPVAVAAAALGHMEPLVLLPLVAFAWAAERRAHGWAALWLGLAILAKTVPVLLVPWLLLRSPRAVLGITLPVVLLGYLPFVPAGDVLGSLHAFAADFAFNGSLFRLVEALLPDTTARVALGALLAVWVLFLAYAEPRPAHAAALAFAGLLAVSPTVHAWYLTWFLVLLPAVWPARVALPLVLWGATVGLVLPTYLDSHRGGAFVEHLPATVLEYALPWALATFLLWKSRPRRVPLWRASGTAPGTYAVVVPARGERENLALLLPRWMETDAREVVVADTPTGDGTEELVATFPRARYVAVAARGYGAAVSQGWNVAGPTDFLVVCDADHADAPASVEALLAPLADPGVGLVTGAREGREGTWPQRVGNGLALGLIALFWGRRFHDLGPYRALRRSALPRASLRDTGFGWNVEMNVRALQLGLGVVEVPAPSAKRMHGKDAITRSLRGVVGAGRGILGRIRALREEALCPCRPPS
jgi:hypothetical protein